MAEKSRTKLKTVMLVFRIAVAFLLLLIISIFCLRSFATLPRTDYQRKNLLVQHLNGLQHGLHYRLAAERMQEIFPEGACFTVTLYALAWCNAAEKYSDDKILIERAREQVAWALTQYHETHVIKPFHNTQVRNGVFWLGQRNLVMARYLMLFQPKNLLSAIDHSDTDAACRSLVAALGEAGFLGYSAVDPGWRRAARRPVALSHPRDAGTP